MLPLWRKGTRKMRECLVPMIFSCLWLQVVPMALGMSRVSCQAHQISKSQCLSFPEPNEVSKTCNHTALEFLEHWSTYNKNLRLEVQSLQLKILKHLVFQSSYLVQDVHNLSTQPSPMYDTQKGQEHRHNGITTKYQWWYKYLPDWHQNHKKS